MSQSRIDFAYSKLREKVGSGKLKPGDRLVNRTLGAELGVSTVTVREAIGRLASDGIVEHVPNAGAYVRKLSAKDTIDLFTFRAWIDLYTVRDAISRIESHEIHRLRICNGQMRELILHMRGVSGRELDGHLRQHWLEIDGNFHKVLGEAARNKWIIKSIDDIQLLWLVMRSKWPVLSFSDAVRTYRMHCEIANALEQHDLERASEWMRIHGDQALASLMRDFEAKGQRTFAASKLDGSSN